MHYSLGLSAGRHPVSLCVCVVLLKNSSTPLKIAQPPLTSTECWARAGSRWDMEGRGATAWVISLLKSCLDACGTFACSISCSYRMSSKGRRWCERSCRMRMTSCPGQRSGTSVRMTSCHPDLLLSAQVKMQLHGCLIPTCVFGFTAC